MQRRSCVILAMTAGLFLSEYVASHSDSAEPRTLDKRKAEATALVTAENFAKIENGMTKDDVQAILGSSKSGHGSAGVWTLEWRSPTDSKKRVEVTLKEGKVIGKHSTMDWVKVETPDPVPDKKKEKPAATSPADKYEKMLADLRSADEKKRAAALKYVARLPYDEEQAPAVSKILERHLNEKDAILRMQVQNGMRNWVTKENADYFLRIIETRPKTNSPNDPTRDKIPFAVEMLVKLQEPRAVEPLCKMLLRGLFDRSTAVDALQKFSPEVAQKEVLKYANDKNNNVRRAVEQVLAAYKTQAGERLTQYLEDLKSAEPNKRFYAADQLCKVDVDPQRRQEVAKALEAQLTDEAAFPAIPAVIGLSKWGGPENEPPLIKLLTHKSAELRSGAAKALQEIGTKKSLPALKKAAAEKDADFSRLAKQAIAAVNARGK